MEKLEKKLADIRARKDQMLANLHALQGAEQMLLELIDEQKAVTENENSND